MRIFYYFRFLVVLLAGLLFAGSYLLATHYRAGEITYRHAPLPGQKYRYEFNVYTYTRIDNQESLNADRDSIEINWGDNTISHLLRINGPVGSSGVPSGENISNSTRKNIYRGYHAYAGFNPFFVISVADPNRIESIINVNFGNSVNIPFVLVDTLFILPDEFFGFNNSPILSQSPIDFANRGYPYIHNPNANDPDGDVLTYEIVSPLGLDGDIITQVPNFQLPNEVVPINNFLPPSGALPPGPVYLFSIDTHTGDILWQNPWQPGIYNIAILIREFRSGIRVGSMIRDMQIMVLNEDNEPPVVENLADECIIVGQNIELQVEATDPDNQTITLEATGIPLEFLNNPAQFSQLSSAPGFRSGLFEWTPDCSQVLSLPYTIVIKATDNYVSSNTGALLPLSDLETWSLRVVAPTPQGFMANYLGTETLLTWDEPYICADETKFIGFSVWRKNGCAPLIPECGQSPADMGFELLTEHLQSYNFLDSDILEGQSYTYLLTAEFSDINTSGGVPLNFSYSFPALSGCISIPHRLPLMLNADVITTSTSGNVDVKWSRPNALALDTLLHPGPYTSELLRTINGTGELLIYSTTAASFSEMIDTSFTDTGINTLTDQMRYRVRFFSNGIEMGICTPASTVFLSLQPQDETIVLSWNESVPWTNFNYFIYRSEDGINFTPLGQTAAPTYADSPLINGKTYCYYVEAYGSYYNELLPEPLINRSQQICDAPRDLTPPCPPVLSVTNDCESGVTEWRIENRLSWLFTDPSCALDAVAYQIFYGTESENLELITTVNFTNQYTHLLSLGIAGCYAITAVDSLGNVSALSNRVCVENCALYDLPNTFTPNGDLQNDLFVPRPGYRFVSKVDFEVFHRWGANVFSTQDPQLNWDGKNNEGKELPEDVYYYTCKVYQGNGDSEQNLFKELSGYIHLIRSK